MELFRYRPDSNSFNGVGLREEDRDLVLDIHYSSHPIGADWRPISIKLFDDCGVDGDFPSVADCWYLPIMSERAWAALHPLIGARAEALPIIHPRGAYFVINILDMIDCLDQERSKVTRSEIDGRISRVWHYEILTELVPPTTHAFKTPLASGAELLIDKHFRRAVKEHGLKGLLFKPLP